MKAVRSDAIVDQLETVAEPMVSSEPPEIPRVAAEEDVKRSAGIANTVNRVNQSFEDLRVSLSQHAHLAPTSEPPAVPAPSYAPVPSHAVPAHAHPAAPRQVAPRGQARVARALPFLRLPPERARPGLQRDANLTGLTPERVYDLTSAAASQFSLANTNVGQAFGYLRSISRTSDDQESERVLARYARSNEGADKLAEYLRSMEQPYLGHLLTVVKLPTASVTDTDLSLRPQFQSIVELCRAARETMYLPKQKYCTPEYLRQLFNQQKTTIAPVEVRVVAMPKFPELELSILYEEWILYPRINIALPDYSKLKSVDSEFFFNVVNTVYPNSMVLLSNAIQANRRVKYITESSAEPEPALLAALKNSKPVKASSDRKPGGRYKVSCEAYEATSIVQGITFHVQGPVS